MSDVDWTDRRRDVIAALDALATLTPGTDREWPDLTNAIHWLVDDTWWDQHPPVEDIGRLLRNDREATTIQEALQVLLPILDELGPDKPDAAYFQHRQWDRVRAAAQTARDLLASHPDDDQQH